MKLLRVDKDAQYVLNHCTKYLARSNLDERHSPLGIFAGQDRARIADCWRYPIVDSHDGEDIDAYDWNDVTFVWHTRDAVPPTEVLLITTCHALYAPIPLAQVEDSDYWSCTLTVRKAERHRYLFRVDGVITPDPINPQIETLPSGEVWSSFFTWAYPQPVSFERWEFAILDRLARHILPANTLEQQNYLSREGQESAVKHLYRLDVSLGVAGYIDKTVAQQERHHLYTYKTCLEMLNTILRKRNAYAEPEAIQQQDYQRLHDEMSVNAVALFVDGWDASRYSDPSYFLKVLRRHAMSGAFSHPKYGGNPAAIGWEYLETRFRTNDGPTAFDWRQAIEAPLGTSTDYRG